MAISQMLATLIQIVARGETISSRAFPLGKLFSQAWGFWKICPGML